MLILDDGTAVLPSGNDPAVRTVKGWDKFVLAVDLAQMNDFTALIGLRDRCLPEWSTSGRQMLGPRSLTAVYADKFRGVSYPAVVSHILKVYTSRPFLGRTRLCYDESGLGRVVGDLIAEANVPAIGVTSTVGQNWSRKGRHWAVGKTLMIESLSVAFAAGELTFAHDLPLREDIIAELETFSLETTHAGNQIITQARSGVGHGDLAISLAIAAFVALNAPAPFSEGKLTNWYG